MSQSSTPQPFTLVVDGMHCGGCVRRVQGALAQVPGVAVDEIVVGKVSGTFDPDDTDEAALVDALTRAGYPARVAGGEEPPRA
jgi:copper chaperone CopZ